MTKAEQRQQAKERLAGCVPGRRESDSAQACEILCALPAFQKSHAILLFASLASEPDTRLAVETAWKKGQRTIFPRINPESHELEFWEVRRWNDFVAGSFGIREPNPEQCKRVAPMELDCVIIPGLGFDRQGNRLGRGRGFYDRTLPILSESTPRIGFFWSCQEFSKIVQEPHDQRLHWIVTEKESIDCSNAA